MARKRKKNLSYNDIQNKHEDWELDERNGLKYSGESVQKFIKQKFEGRVGEIYYDAGSTKYLCFADKENRDTYLDNPTAHAALLLGTFDAPANYTAEINLSTPTNNTVLSGSTGNYIDFTFDVKNKSGASTGDSVVANFVFNNGGNKKTVTQIYAAGTAVHFLADQYLEDGTNSVTITISGRSTLAGTTGAVIFTMVNLKLTSTFDFSQGVSKGSNLAIPYTLEGAGVKYLEWYIDGTKLSQVDDITDLKVTRTKNIDTTPMAAGKHSLQVRAYIINNGQNYYSDTLYFDFYVSNGETATAILLGVTLEEPTDGTLAIDGTQYEEMAYKLAVYDSRNRTLSVAVSDNGDQIQSVRMQPATVEALSYTPTTNGNHTLTFEAGGATASIALDVAVSTIGISETTDGLLLKLTAKGRSNSETTPGTWTFTQAAAQGGNTIETTFSSGFEWNEQSGWNRGALVIPAGEYVNINLAPLAGRPSQAGRTIEIDYETEEITDENASVISLVNSQTNAGLEITASTASLQSSGGANVNTKYRAGDRNHLAFIVNKTTGDNARLMFIVNNGILERAASFAGTDSFNATNTLHIGSAGCRVRLHSIRVYDRNLSVEEAFGNFAVDADNIIEIASRNDILNNITGKIDADKVNAKIPIMIITGDMQPIFDATDKNTTVYVDIEYRNLQDATKNFTATGVRMRPQGTSSLGYPRKNLRPYTSAQYGCVMKDANGAVLEDGLYAFKDGSQPVNCWTLKADYAESSGSHNTGVARIWNELMYKAQMSGGFPLRTEAQKKAIQSGYNFDVRTTVDGFPIVVFWRTDPNSELVCLGQYNFNNDKSTEKVFGFCDIPGFDNTNVQCFEFKANEEPIALFDDITDFDENWDDAFESRYPDTKTPNLTPLKTLATWINSCKNNQQKWNDEKANHFDLPKLAAYYVYLMRFGAVDQAVKNAMIMTEDGEHWFFINYDNDTILGIDNISTVLNRWDYDRSTSKGGGKYYYAGHESVLWNCFEADPECMALVAEVDEALYSAGLTYANLCKMFDEEQCDKWCERLYNDNGHYKYIQPFQDKGSAVLYMLQGSRKSYRHWWLQHRMDLYDAKWATGAFKSRVVRFIAEGAENASFEVTSATDTYYGYGINSIPQEIGVRIQKNASHTFTISQRLAIGDPVVIYNANNASRIDLSDFADHLSTLYINAAVGNDGKSELKALILGDGVKENSEFTEIGGLTAITDIEELDIRGFTAITSMELAALQSLHIFKAAGSGLTSFVPATGATLTNVTLPASLQSIVLDGARVTGLTYTPTTTLRSVTMRNVTGTFDVKTFINTWLALLSDAQLAQAEMTLTGINWTGMTAAQVLAMGKVGTKTLTGKVTLSSLTQGEYQQLVEVFGANAFSDGGSFVIDAPAGVVISVDNENVEPGSGAQVTATAFPVKAGTTIVYNLYKNGTLIQPVSGIATTDGISLNTATGAITTTEQAGATVTVKAVATVDGTSVESSAVTIVVQPLTYPSSLTLTGADNVRETGTYEYTKAFDTNNFTARVLSVAWQLTQNAASSLTAQTNSGATLTVTDVPEEVAVEPTLTCTVTLTGGRTLTATKTITIKAAAAGVGSVITIDESIADPATRVTNEAGQTSANWVTPESVQAIREDSHRYLGKYVDDGNGGGKMLLCQLSDTDSTKFFDGTTAASLDGTMGDVWMKHPDVYIKATKEGDEVSLDISTSDNGGRLFPENDLIGVYEANYANSKLRSISGVQSTGNVSQANFHSYAAARGAGFSLVKPQHQNLMAVLFYAMYGHTNCQAICGAGTNAYDKATGQTNSLGMTDTTTANGNSMSINFWGLENWWGNKYEFMDNVVINNGVWTITEDDGTTRTITAPTNSAWVYPKKFIWGDGIDVVPLASETGGSDSQGYCDGYYGVTSSSRVALRSCYDAYTYGGVAYVLASFDSSSPHTGSGSRLAFHGQIEVTTDVQAFIAATQKS